MCVGCIVVGFSWLWAQRASVREGDAHVGVLISRDGVIFRQKQIHFSATSPWATDVGDTVATFDLPFGRLAIVVGDDAKYPETFRLAAYQNAEIVAVLFAATERWLTEFGLVGFQASVESGRLLRFHHHCDVGHGDSFSDAGDYLRAGAHRFGDREVSDKDLENGANRDPDFCGDSFPDQRYS